MFDFGKFKQVENLFYDDKFIAEARKICPAEAQHLDPTQFNFIMQVPGQTVATHIDGVYFWGATRFQFPQWLLAAMQFSGLWADRFVPQVQVVGYLHEWDPANFTNPDDAGPFMYWSKPGQEEPTRVAPIPLVSRAPQPCSTRHILSRCHGMPLPSGES